MLSEKNTILVVVDVQGNLAQQMDEREALFRNLRKLVQGVVAMGMPVLWLEQNPARLGETVPEVAGLLRDRASPIAKMSFSACGEKAFLQELASSGRRQVLLAGIETHVCVYQTAVDLLREGYEVSVVSDAVSSRTAANRCLGLSRMQSEGVRQTGVEMALFELLRTAGHPAFREILGIVR